MKISMALDNESTKGGWFSSPTSKHVFTLEVRMSDEELDQLKAYAELHGNQVWFEYERDMERKVGLHSSDPRENLIAEKTLANLRAEGRVFGERLDDLHRLIRKKGFYQKKFIYQSASERDSAVEQCKQQLAFVKDHIENFADRTGEAEEYEL